MRGVSCQRCENAAAVAVLSDREGGELAVCAHCWTQVMHQAGHTLQLVRFVPLHERTPRQ